MSDKSQQIMIKAIIFDLDNRLAAANEFVERLFAPAFDAMRQANRGAVSEVVLLEAFADLNAADGWVPDARQKWF